jgi:hypothetical protein
MKNGLEIVLPTGLRRLVAIDLKLREFEPADKGTDGVLPALAGTARAAAREGLLLGLLLCAGKWDEHVELLGPSEAGIRVAAYLTELPVRELLERKLHEAAFACNSASLPEWCDMACLGIDICFYALKRNNIQPPMLVAKKLHVWICWSAFRIGAEWQVLCSPENLS